MASCGSARYRHSKLLLLAHCEVVMHSRAKYSTSVHGRNLIKILKAVDVLARPQGATIKELQDELGVARRSVYRLFDTLSELQFPIYDEERPGEKEKRWRLQPDYLHSLPNLRVPDMKLSPRELLLLYFLLSQDRVFEGTTVAGLLASVREKLAALMPTSYLTAAQSERIETLFAAGTLHPKSYERHEETIETLLDAIVERRTCTVTYTALSHGETNSYTINPLRLFEHDGGLYVFVRLPEPNVTRIIAVDRIEKIDVTQATFEEPDDFAPERILASTFDLTLGDPVNVEIRFSPRAARRMQNRRWSASQTIETHDDGSVTLRMSTSGGDDVVRWVLSFGDEAEIVSPAALRTRLAAKARAALERHSG
jgi:predicted DNA-binding transcriptional regulator YafY